MTLERYREINSIVDDLLALSADRRAAFLDGACAGDSTLRRQVEALLEAHDSQDSFLQSPALELIAGDMAADPRGNDLAGRVLGGYEIVSPLGAGGIGEVWLAKDPQLPRMVALKLLSAKYAGDPKHILRFQQEARAASTLSHPNIVTIYEIGEADGLDFIAEEFVDGVTLRQQFASGRMPLPAVLDLGTQVAAALAAAHRAGIVHRDIKPENLMIRSDGLVKVLDFGLARFVELAARNDSLGLNENITVPGLVLGTVKYMSPEQARGLPLDHRSDLFSFGIVLYEAAAGKAPFSGSTQADTLASILSDDPAPMATHAPDLPAEFERMIFRCLEKDRAARYPDADSLRLELNQLAQRLAGSERLPPVSRAAKKRRALLGGVVAILAIAAAMLFAFLPHRNQIGNATAFLSMKIGRLMLRGPVLDAALAPGGKDLAYVAQEGAGESIWLTHLPTSANTRRITSEKGAHSGLIFSPDERYLYYRRSLMTEQGTLYRLPLAKAGRPERILDNVSGGVAFSPDGRELAFVRVVPALLETQLIVAGVDGGQPREIAMRKRPEYLSRFGLAWSPDGRSLVCFAGNGPGHSSHSFHLERVRVADGFGTTVSGKSWRLVDSILWPRGANFLLVNGGETEDAFQIWRISLTTGDYSMVTDDLTSYRRLSLTSDGRTLAAVQSERPAALWVTSIGKNAHPAQISSGEIHGLDSLAWTPGGRIVYTALTGDNRNIWITDANGANSSQLTFGAGDKKEVTVTRDGRYVVYQSEGKIWRLKLAGGDERQLTQGVLDVHPVPSADGQNVIYASFLNWSPAVGGRPTLWEVPMEGGKSIQLAQDSASLPQVSPDGRFIACSYYPDGDPRFSDRQIALLPDNGGPLQVLDRLPPFNSDFVWTPDGKGITFSRSLARVGNVWRQPLRGGAPVQITHFTDDDVFTFRWSLDGKRLAMARGKQMSDVVLINDF